MIIMTNDPSLTAWGWAIIEHKTNEILASGCIKTEPQSAKLRIRKSDDTERRIGELITQLMNIIRKYDPVYIVTESPHGSQNANAAKMIGIVTGIIKTISMLLEIPLDSYSEQDAKKALHAKKIVTKLDTIIKISEIYGTSWVTGTKYINEAVADAIAVYHAAKLEQGSIFNLFK